MFKVSIIIITRNRAHDLQHCLLSLFSQSVLPTEIVIIDNGSTDKTKSMIENIQKNIDIRIRYIYEKKQGRFAARNRGLKEAIYGWIAFIDDDCVADSNWLKNVETFIDSHKKKPQAVMGYSETYYPKNIFALSTHLIDIFWKTNRIVKETVIDPEILDTRNVFFDKIFLERNKLQFRRIFPNSNMDFAEDCDFGMQFGAAGGKAVYHSKAVIWHKDPTSFTDYWKKFIQYGFSHSEYERMWKQYRKREERYYLRFIPFVVKYFDSRQLGETKACIIFVNCVLTIILRKVFQFMFKLFAWKKYAYKEH